jgi:hypothetical protein
VFTPGGYGNSITYRWRSGSVPKTGRRQLIAFILDAARGKATKWSTFFSGIALVVAMIAVGAFAFQNMRFVQP